MSGINQLLRDAKTSTAEASRHLTRIESADHVDIDDIQCIQNSARQAEQAVKELNQLIGMLTMKYYGD